MAVQIASVTPGGIAQKLQIQAQETLVSINGHEIMDVLDYRFYETDRVLRLVIEGQGGTRREVEVKKREYEPLGLEFSTYLMDNQHSCHNQCIFCFIDQLPKGLRESLYFKDDDSRLSFLFGNYVTLTNLSEHEIDRIIRMHISPINISVHTTNRALRVKMMHNRFAGDTLDILDRFCKAGIKMNFQLVLCPGINDGEELKKTLQDLALLHSCVDCIAVVPVGLTKYRDGLFPLVPYQQETAAAVIDIVEQFGKECMRKYGKKMAYPADEFYLKAGRPFPDASFYDDFDQLENGVGLLPLLLSEFYEALETCVFSNLRPRKVTLATGMAAFPFLRQMVADCQKKYPQIVGQVVGIKNYFLGETITVAGLVTGRDLISQLQGVEIGEELLLPSCMLRHERDLFLDSVSLEEVQQTFQVPVNLVENDGYQLLEKLVGSEA